MAREYVIMVKIKKNRINLLEVIIFIHIKQKLCLHVTQFHVLVHPTTYQTTATGMNTNFSSKDRNRFVVYISWNKHNEKRHSYIESGSFITA